MHAGRRTTATDRTRAAAARCSSNRRLRCALHSSSSAGLVLKMCDASGGVTACCATGGTDAPPPGAEPAPAPAAGAPVRAADEKKPLNPAVAKAAAAALPPAAPVYAASDTVALSALELTTSESELVKQKREFQREQKREFQIEHGRQNANSTTPFGRAADARQKRGEEEGEEAVPKASPDAGGALTLFVVGVAGGLLNSWMAVGPDVRNFTIRTES